MRNLAGDRSIVIKPADKGPCVVVCDCQDYLSDAENKLSDIQTYEEVTFGKHDHSYLVDRINDCFLELKRKKLNTEKE